MNFKTVIRLLALVGAAVCSPLAHGQASEAQSISCYFRAKATLNVANGPATFSMSTDIENSDGSFQTIGLSETLQLNTNPLLPGHAYSGIYTAPQSARLDVGRVYWIQAATTNIRSMTINFDPPPGYEVHFFDANSATYDNETRQYKFATVDSEPGWDGHFGTLIGLCITPDSTEKSGGQAGSSNALTTSGASFRIYMGYLPNGTSAGYLEMNDRGRASAGFTDAFNSDAMAYVAPSSEIIVHSDGAGGRRIFAYEAGVSILPLSSPAVGYTVSFYNNSQVTDDVNAGPSFSGTPFVTYTFQQDGSPTNLKITRTATGPSQTVTKVATIQRTGSGWWSAPDYKYTFTLSDWHTDGQPAIVSVSTVLTPGVGSLDHNENITLSSTVGGTSQVSSQQIISKTFGEAPTHTEKGSTQSESADISYYESDPTAIGAYSRPKLVTANNGAWNAYEYFATTYNPGGNEIQFTNVGMVLRKHQPYKNTAAPAASDDLSASTAGVVTTYQYQSDNYTIINGLSLRPSDELTQIDGTTVAHSSTVYVDETTPLTYAGLSLPVVTATRSDYADSSTPLQTITKYIPEYSVSTNNNPLHPTAGQYFGTSPFWRKQVLSIQKPDHSKQVYAYQHGTYSGGTFTPNTTSSPFDIVPGEGWHWIDRTASTNPSAASRTVVIAGTALATNADGTANTAYSSYAGFPLDTVYLVAGKSTLEVTIRDLSALVRRTEKWAWVGGAFQLVASEDLSYDAANNLVSRVSNTGATYTATYDGGRKTSETDAAGVTINYTYDDAGRVSSTTKVGVSGQADLRTDFTYDAAGRVVSADVHAVGGTEHLVTSHAYDDAGRLSSETQPGHGTTSYAYAPTSNQVTATLPNGGTRIETSYSDGQKYSVTGTGVIAQFYSYDIQTGGLRHASVATGSSTSSRIQENWTDWLGRTVKKSHPALAGSATGSFVETSMYDATTGLLTKSTRADANGNSLYADSLYSYDSLGRAIRSGSDITADGVLTLASSDRIADTNEYFELFQGAYWVTKQTVTYPTVGSGTPQVTGLTRQRLTGFTGTLQAESIAVDINGNVTDSQTLVNRSTATTTTSTTATGLANAQSSVTVNGLVSTTTGFDGLTTTTKYDDLQRANESDDPLNRATKTTFYPSTALPYQVTDPTLVVVATYSYDTAGRTIAVTNAANNVSRTEYDSLDHVVHQWGDGAFPVEYGYNSLGERTTMRTYRGGTGWSGTSWPTTVGVADTTTWSFDPATGLLMSKTDAANQAVSYTYNARGQTATRTWARGAVTTYGYDDNTGELLSQTYSDATPAVTYQYTRAGLVSSVADVTGTRTYVYNAGQPQRLDATDLSAFYGSRVLTENYDAIFRPAGFLLGTTSNLSSDLSQTHTYNTLGRFDHLTSVSSAQTSREFDYSYNGVGLVSGLTIPGSAFAVNRSYETNRNLLTAIATVWSAASRTRYDYTYDAVGRRSTAKQSGDVFADFGGSTYHRYAYDARSELTDAADYLGEDPTSTTSPQLSGRHHAYTYDTIGNRMTASRTGSAGTPDSFSTNPLNQYISRTNNYAHTAGTVANSTITVGVSGTNGAIASSVGRQGRYWDAQLVLGNSGGPASSQLTVTATAAGAGAGGVDLVRTDSSRKAFIAAATQSFSYDVDGNLTGDGMWAYGYDAENRLITMTTTSVAVAAGFPNQLLDFKYDYASRRVEKHVQNVTAGTDTTNRYLYDGDNVVAEYAVSSPSTLTLTRSYTWGLDLAGSLSATGGVGALVQVTDHATSVAYFPAYDGNGNVAALLQASDGTVAAKYEYSPFGELLRCEGSYAATNSYRFSTKATDDETGLVYYGARYYSAPLGRFINRDPIGEQGGLDLYGFCLNDPIDHWDVLGNSSATGTNSADVYERQLRDNADKIGQKATDSAFKEAAAALAATGGDFNQTVANLESQRATKENSRSPSGSILPKSAARNSGLTIREGIGAFFSGLGEGAYDVAMAFRALPEGLGGLAGAASVDFKGTVTEAHGTITTNLANGFILVSETTFTDLKRDVVTAGGLYINDHDFRQSVTNGLAGTGTGIALGGVSGAFARDASAAEKIPGVCFVVGTLIATANGAQPIQALRVGDRVLTNDQNAEVTEVTPSTWRKITLRMPNPECPADVIDLELLRSTAWMQQVGCLSRARIWFNLEEMGLHGWADVIQIESCPSIQDGPGRVVLATVSHFNSYIMELRLEGLDEVLQPTDRHRLLSVTRNAWVPSAQLAVGEELATRTGSVRVASVTRKSGTHRVYNIEVETEHWYYAGSAQVLSHNNNPCAMATAKSAPLPGTPEFIGPVVRSATDILRPGGKLIGQAGSSSAIRVVNGGLAEAEAVFAELSHGAKITTTTTKTGGVLKIAQLPNGDVIRLRPVSTSGPPTIDVNINGIGVREVKFR